MNKRTINGRYPSEQLFESILIQHGIEYQFHKIIRTYGAVLCIPDFYLPLYDVYCEVQRGLDTLWKPGRFQRIKIAINQGFNFTFYQPDGHKIVLDDKLLKKMGISSNYELFTIPELFEIKE